MDVLKNKYFFFLSLLVMFSLSAFLLAKTADEIKNTFEITQKEKSSITVKGKGTVKVVPDIASFYLTVEEHAKTQQEASDKLAKKVNKIMDLLRSKGIDEKDIKTENYSLSPKYYWEDGKRKQDGYTASERIKVKVRDKSKASSIIAGISEIGVSYISSLSFEVDDLESYREKARKKAIEDAKRKAKLLAEQLGVKLGKLLSYSEVNGGYRKSPIYYATKSVMLESADNVTPPELPSGENEITVNVSLTYEIK